MAIDRVSGYLTHLPALFQEDAFVGRLLLAFERILSGLQPPDSDEPRLATEGGTTEQPPGLEEIIDKIYTYFVPGPQLSPDERAPKGFLPWLASWVALSVREDWEEEEKRRFISRIVSLYRHRGTKYGLEQILETYTDEDAVIYEFDQPPHYFQVEMTLSEPTPEGLRRKERIARAIIDQEKPAHTFYALRILVPTMRIVNADPDRGIRVGQTTLLGTTAGKGGS